MASARVLVFLLFVFHLPAARGPGLGRPGQARHLAAAAGAVVAEAADHKRSAFFLFGCAPHPVRHREAGGSVAELPLAHRFHVADVQLRPEVPACRTADVQVLRRYPAAKSVLPHHARDLPAHLVVGLAGDHVVAVATAHPRKLTAVLLSLLRPGRAREIARLA